MHSFQVWESHGSVWAKSSTMAGPPPKRPCLLCPLTGSLAALDQSAGPPVQTLGVLERMASVLTLIRQCFSFPPSRSVCEREVKEDEKLQEQTQRRMDTVLSLKNNIASNRVFAWPCCLRFQLCKLLGRKRVHFFFRCTGPFLHQIC